jgi:hypothetical protein
MTVSVPKMTSNTAPYGEASASSVAQSGFEAYKAFDGNTSTDWQPSSKTNERISYEFTSLVCVKQVSIRAISADGTRLKNFKIQAYDGSDWVDLGSYVYPSGAAVYVVDVANDDCYTKYAVFCIDHYAEEGNRYFRITEIQFYGKDYSEKEWDTNHPRKYIYDNGVELETLTIKNHTGTLTKQDDGNGVILSSSGNVYGHLYSSAIDFTSLNLLRLIVGDRYVSDGISMRVFTPSDINTSSASAISTLNPISDVPYNPGLDVSNVNGDNSATITFSASTGSRTIQITEWRLE